MPSGIPGKVSGTGTVSVESGRRSAVFGVTTSSRFDDPFRRLKYRLSQELCSDSPVNPRKDDRKRGTASSRPVVEAYAATASVTDNTTARTCRFSIREAGIHNERAQKTDATTSATATASRT